MREYNAKHTPFDILHPREVATAHARISHHIHRMPLLTSSLLNTILHHDIIFKAENFQKIGAFKARGVMNKLLLLQEQEMLPKHVVAFSEGNHSQAVAWAAKQFHIKSTILLSKAASKIKIQATQSYGAEAITTKTRQEGEARTLALANEGMCLFHPYDDDAIITGQGTAVFEALQDMDEEPDAIFTACGGGGLLSGSYLAKELLSPKTKIFGVEPKNANDASISYQKGKIYRFDDTPQTIADGVKTLSLTPRTFHYIKNIDGFIEAAETKICYWVQWLSHVLKVMIEPTGALAMVGAHQWLKSQKTKKRILVVLSGGNTSSDTVRKIWQYNHLQRWS